VIRQYLDLLSGLGVPQPHRIGRLEKFLSPSARESDSVTARG